MRSEQKIKLADNLKRLMASKNITLTSVARQTGMNKSTLHNYCNGVIPRNLLKLKELSDLFGVSLGELIFGENQQSVPHQQVADILNGKFEIVLRRIE